VVTECDDIIACWVSGQRHGPPIQRAGVTRSPPAAGDLPR